MLCVLKVAVMAGHFELGEIIKNHQNTDTGECLPSPRSLHMERQHSSH